MKRPLTITASELQEFERRDKRVKKNASAVYELVEDLLAIREGKLYRHKFGTFEAYCESRGFSRQRAHQLLLAAQTQENLKAALVNAGGEDGDQIDAVNHELSDAILSTTVDILDTENEAEQAAAPVTFDVPAEERQLREIARAPKEKQPAVTAAAQAKAKAEGRKATASDYRAAAERVCVLKRPLKPLKPDQVKGEPEPPKAPREKVHRADADLPESYNDEEGNAVPESLWPVWRDIGQFMDVVDGVRSGGMLESAKKLRLLGDKHGSAEVMNIATRLEELHKAAVELAMSAKPSVVCGGNWFTRSEA